MLLVLRQAVRLALHVAVHRLTERRQSKPAKDSASIVKRAKERFRNSESDHSDHQQKSALRSPTKSLTFPPLSDSAQKSARCTWESLGLVSFPQTWKKKSKPPWKAAMVPSAPAWSLRLSACCLWPARMFNLPRRKVRSYMNISATVIVGTQDKHLNGYRIASSNMFRNG